MLKFWSKKKSADNSPSALPKPKEMPDRVGRYLVVDMKQDPDVVWNWKVVSLPATGSGTESEIRVFSPDKVGQAGVSVKNYHSLDDHPALILYSGRFDKKAGKVSLKAHAPLAAAV
jgi:hypothetical protein